ncbi:MAG TPA: peptidase dimerization domain-containing protein, partial [Vicinamibacterales bacterium]|nr:peptidase dimerization domain-containing protein [Vicinamibacterales bacterium]
KIADFMVPDEPKTTFNVGRVGGGTSVNSIASEAWFEIDMRSADYGSLQSVDARFSQAVERAVDEENDRWNHRGQVSATVHRVGSRPAGRIPSDALIVKRTVVVTRALGLPAGLAEASSDSNVPISMGVPAVTIDGGGSVRASHSLEETFDATDSWRGTARAALLAVELSRP